MSGFRDCLAISLDGVGDRISGLVCSVRGGELETLRSLSVPESLGLFYLYVIRYLGYDLFDEYKVMGLAPYGDPAVYREALQTAYKLLPEGRWSIYEDRLVEALNAYRLAAGAHHLRSRAKTSPRRCRRPSKRSPSTLSPDFPRRTAIGTPLFRSVSL